MNEIPRRLSSKCEERPLGRQDESNNAYLEANEGLAGEMEGDNSVLILIGGGNSVRHIS